MQGSAHTAQATCRCDEQAVRHSVDLPPLFVCTAARSECSQVGRAHKKTGVSTYRLCSSVNSSATLAAQNSPSTAINCVRASRAADCSSWG